MSGPRRRTAGVAMIAALLTLAAVGALAAALFLLLRLDIALANNRQQQAVSRAEAQSNLTAALLALERAAGEGELPDEWPAATEGVDRYSITGEHTAVIAVVGAAGKARAQLQARIELIEAEGGWRVRLIDLR